MTNKARSAAREVRAPGRRSSAEAAQTRARILEAAERRFARKGYRGLSLRELAKGAGVRMFTVQHHFGSKLELYREVLRRRDREVEALVRGFLGAETRPAVLVERVVDELFDYFLEHRDWVALRARAALGEGLPGDAALAGRTWVGFMGSAMRLRRIGAPGIDLRLLLITVEGVLNNHALAVGHYQRLFGRGLADPALAGRTKAHLKRVILAVLGERDAE